MTFSSAVNFGGLKLPVGDSEWMRAEFAIRGVAVDFTVKGGGTGCTDLEGGYCESRVTGGIDKNVTLVWALISEDAVVTTFSRLETASAEDFPNVFDAFLRSLRCVVHNINFRPCTMGEFLL